MTYMSYGEARIRETAVELIRQAVNRDGYDVVVVTGWPRGGKSHLRRMLAKYYSDNGTIVGCFFPTLEQARLNAEIDERDAEIDLDFAYYLSAQSPAAFRRPRFKVGFFDDADRMLRHIHDGDIFDLGLACTRTYEGGKIVVFTDSTALAENLKAKFGAEAIVLDLPPYLPGGDAQLPLAKKSDAIITTIVHEGDRWTVTLDPKTRAVGIDVSRL